MKYLTTRSSHSSPGFTLVELLVVISIIGIIAALLLVNLSNVRERGRDSARKSDLAQMRTALRLYYNDNQTYPTAASGEIVGCGAAGDVACAWGADFGPTGTKYITLPEDPIATQVYTYAPVAGGNGFRLSAQLENLSDPQAVESQGRCGVASGAVVAGVFMICAD